MYTSYKEKLAKEKNSLNKEAVEKNPVNEGSIINSTSNVQLIIDHSNKIEPSFSNNIEISIQEMSDYFQINPEAIDKGNLNMLHSLKIKLLPKGFLKGG